MQHLDSEYITKKPKLYTANNLYLPQLHENMHTHTQTHRQNTEIDTTAQAVHFFSCISV